MTPTTARPMMLLAVWGVPLLLVSSVLALTGPRRSNLAVHRAAVPEGGSASTTVLSSSASGDDHSPPFEMAFERDASGGSGGGGSGASAAAAAAVPTRTKRHRSRKKPGKKKGTSSSSSASSSAHSVPKRGPLTEGQVAHHVASQYVKGRGGLFHVANARRNRMEGSSSLFASDPSHREHADYLRKLDAHPALVLNADYQPLSVLPLSLWSWQDSVKAIFSGKCQVVEVYTGVNIRAVNLDVPLPSVIALTEYAPQDNKRPAFTRRNVFLRDSYRCQYCGQHFRTCDLSLDHYVPRSMGGKLEWENAVTCCRKCNGRKGSVHPSNLKSIGMRPLREPRVPTKWELASTAGKMLPKKVHPTWAPYLGYDIGVTETDLGHGREGVKSMFDGSDL